MAALLFCCIEVFLSYRRNILLPLGCSLHFVEIHSKSLLALENTNYVNEMFFFVITQVDDTEVISFLLQTEIIPLCLRTMEMGSELSKTVCG